MALRLRIIALVVLFAAFLIAGFAAIQVYNQLNALNAHNTYRVRVGASSAKTSLEFTLAVHAAQRPTEDPLPALKSELARLQSGGLCDGAALLTLEGTALATAEPIPSRDALDTRWGPFAATTYTPEQWVYTAVTPAAVHAYVPLLLGGKPRYVARFTFGLANIRKALRDVYGPSLVMAVGVVLLSTLLVWLLTRAILGPIQELNDATRDIAAGNLSLKVRLATGDELQELADTFNEMGEALVRMKARAENANPLTKLPGNTVIREQLERRIQANTPFVAVYADLDHFKAFNDQYGIAAGDEAIKLTATIMKEALRAADAEGFLGHEGGDDFVVLTTPDRADAVTQHVCREFDQRIRALYAPQDLARGGIVAKDREGNVREFPIMTISLAGATNVHRPISSYAEVTNICAEVKKKAKRGSHEARRSSFVMDRRRGEHPSAATPPPAAA